MSGRYWLLDTSQRADGQLASTLEPDLIGRQMLFQSLLLAITQHDDRIELLSAQTLMDAFFDDLTGGSFKEARRLPDLEKAQSAHTNAALINGALRSALAGRANTWI